MAPGAFQGRAQLPAAPEDTAVLWNVGKRIHSLFSRRGLRAGLLDRTFKGPQSHLRGRINKLLRAQIKLVITHLPRPTKKNKALLFDFFHESCYRVQIGFHRHAQYVFYVWRRTL